MSTPPEPIFEDQKPAEQQEKQNSTEATGTIERTTYVDRPRGSSQ